MGGAAACWLLDPAPEGAGGGVPCGGMVNQRAALLAAWRLAKAAWRLTAAAPFGPRWLPPAALPFESCGHLVSGPRAW